MRVVFSVQINGSRVEELHQTEDSLVFILGHFDKFGLRLLHLRGEHCIELLTLSSQNAFVAVDNLFFDLKLNIAEILLVKQFLLEILDKRLSHIVLDNILLKSSNINHVDIVEH